MDGKRLREGPPAGKRVRGHLLLGGFCLLLTLEQVPAQTRAQAQSKAPAASSKAKAKKLGEVDVNGQYAGYVAKDSRTGSKSRMPIILNPQSISVVTRQQMDDQGAMTVDAALRYTGGIYTQDGSDVRFDQLRGRGFDIDSYMDGLRLMSTPRFVQPRVDTYLMEQIDVLHGPSSVMYGQGNPGGLVNFVSKLPTEAPFRETVLTVGNHNRYQLGFDMGGPANSSGSVLYRVVGLGRAAHTDVSGMRDHRVAIAPSVTFKIDPRTKLTLLGGYDRDPEGGLFNPVPAEGSVHPGPGGRRLSPDRYYGDPHRDHQDRTEYWIGDQFEHHFSDDWSIEQSLRYMHIDEHYYQTSITGGFDKDGRVPLWANIDNEHDNQLTYDMHLVGKFHTGAVEHNFLFGGDFLHHYDTDHIGGPKYSGMPDGSWDPFHPDYGSEPRLDMGPLPLRYRLRQEGIYVQDQMQYRHVVLTVAGREDWAKTTSGYPFELAGIQTKLRQKANNARFTWRTGLAYQFDNGLVPYASYTTSFMPTAAIVLPASIRLPNGESVALPSKYNPLKPTTGKQYEFGLRYRPRHYDAYYTLAFFNLREQNVTTTAQANPQIAEQTGSVRSKGIELEAHVDPTENLKLVGTYTYLNQIVTSDPDRRKVGKRPTVAPRNMATLWGDYTLFRGALRGLGYSGGVRYGSSTAGDPYNSFRVPGRTLVDLAMHYDLGHVRLALNTSNVFNRHYVSYCMNANSCYWGATRSYYLTARYQW